MHGKAEYETRDVILASLFLEKCLALDFQYTKLLQ